ncbi:hypothetical protein SESBI_05632 [Sesbania bispinosa]|nr:hypothetical protein SESBI_05632 [Sesbania bispinosa]
MRPSELKEIAEKKFVAKDILGARKFALKAQSLFPSLDGISEMLTTINVYISATNEINGKVVLNRYGILGVDPLADDDTLRKQYRKLVHMLHPDNNKSIGADGAFKLVSEAWNILSDKAKRVAYDEKINARTQGKTIEEISKKPSTTTYDDMESMLSIDAPNPHFYCFDLDRIEGSFGENQVWAAFDEEEGMPRYYAVIHNVISMNPFKMQFNWLHMKKTKVERTPTLNWGTIFRRELDLREIRVIPRKEILRFSHQVPSTILSGEEAPDAPNGCWELDPQLFHLNILR